MGGGGILGGGALHILVWSPVPMTSPRHLISYALWVLWDFHLPLPMSHICTVDEIIQFHYTEKIEQKKRIGLTVVELLIWIQMLFKWR